MIRVNKKIYEELELISSKIERNTAKLEDYQRYEFILVRGGLPREYILSYIKKDGFNTWSEFIAERNQKNRESQKEKTEDMIVAGLIGVGIGYLIASFIND